MAGANFQFSFICFPERSRSMTPQPFFQHDQPTSERDKIVFMLQHFTRRTFVLIAGIGVVLGSLAIHAQDDDSHHGRKYKAPPPSARIEITVLRDSSGKPIRDAHVIFHPIKGDKDTGYLELKSNEDGKVVIDVLPVGDTVRMQVIANGFQTYGQDYKVDKAEMSMEVRMKRPGEQYSIYKNSASNPGTGTGAADDKSNKSSQNAAPPDAGSKPSGSSSQPDAQPNASQPQPQAK
jgi:hypothetical protein